MEMKNDVIREIVREISREIQQVRKFSEYEVESVITLTGKKI